jgi:hypothetical protein
MPNLRLRHLPAEVIVGPGLGAGLEAHLERRQADRFAWGGFGELLGRAKPCMSLSVAGES